MESLDNAVIPNRFFLPMPCFYKYVKIETETQHVLIFQDLQNAHHIFYLYVP